jgi:hypothetical protein
METQSLGGESVLSKIKDTIKRLAEVEADSPRRRNPKNTGMAQTLDRDKQGNNPYLKKYFTDMPGTNNNNAALSNRVSGQDDVDFGLASLVATAHFQVNEDSLLRTRSDARHASSNL